MASQGGRSVRCSELRQVFSISPLYSLGCSLLTVSGSRYVLRLSQSRLEELDGRTE